MSDMQDTTRRAIRVARICVLGALLLCGCGRRPPGNGDAAEPAVGAATGPAETRETPATAALEPYVPVEHDPSCYLCSMGVTSADRWPEDVIAAKKDWQVVPEDVLRHTFRHDALIVNGKITAVFRRGGPGAEIYVAGPAGLSYRALISPRSGARIDAVGIVENTAAGVRLNVEFGGLGGPVSAGIRLTPGEPGLEMIPGGGTSSMAVMVDTGMVIAPNYFADDMLFTADNTRRARVLLPMEQFYLHPIAGGDSIMMCVCPSDTQEAVALFDKTDTGRAMVGSEITFDGEQGAFVFFMEYQGIWHGRTRAGDPAGDTDWKPPVDAVWRMIAGTGTARARSTSFDGKLPGAESGAAFAVYPIERTRGTPITLYAVRDVMRNTLGIGPCEYMVKAEGLVNADTPHDVVGWIENQVRKGKAEKNVDLIGQRLANMVEHVGHSAERIREYARMAGTVSAAIPAGSASDAAAAELRATLARIRADADTGLKCAGSDGEVKALADTIAAAIRAEDGAQRMNEAAGKLKSVGDIQDRALAACRMETRWLRQQARMASAENPGNDAGWLERVRKEAERMLGAKRKEME